MCVVTRDDFIVCVVKVLPAAAASGAAELTSRLYVVIRPWSALAASDRISSRVPRPLTQRYINVVTFTMETERITRQVK